ncbi:AraC family transcriptional regulator [Streptomyces sp. NPDC048606]|uniref:helix-turn-helix transcriptional regulator n=1 Tax=Streptomyces sp. NPDC048606 TaxID=3154726 RepID=UPI003428F0D3
MEQLISHSDGDIEDFLARAGFPRARLESREGSDSGPATRISRVSSGVLVLDEARYACSFSFDFDTMDGVLTALIHSGTVTYRSGSRRETYCGGDVAFLPPTSGPCSGTVRSMETTGTILDPVLLRNTAPAGAAEVDRGVRFTAHRPHSPAAAQLVRAALLYLRDGVLANPLARQSPLLVASAGQVLAHALLTAFPNDVVEAEPALTDTRDGNRAALERAVRFIEENAHREVGLGDIARAARVTPRALQYAFSRHGDCSPYGYLRRVRLARAHSDLKAAQPGGGESVRRIAARWGFSNPGRFAAAYRAAYGVDPATTLRFW